MGEHVYRENDVDRAAKAAIANRWPCVDNKDITLREAHRDGFRDGWNAAERARVPAAVEPQPADDRVARVMAAVDEAAKWFRRAFRGGWKRPDEANDCGDWLALILLAAGHMRRDGDRAVRVEPEPAGGEDLKAEAAAIRKAVLMVPESMRDGSRTPEEWIEWGVRRGFRAASERAKGGGA